MRRPKKESGFFDKSIAILLLISFTLLNTVSNPYPLSAEPLHGSILHHGINQADPRSVVDSLSLPEGLGTIREKYNPEKGTGNNSLPVPFSVIYLESAHANLDSETNVREIINYLEKNHGLSLVLLEGGEGRLDSLFFKSFPDRDRKEKLLNEYLSQGDLSGGEVQSILDESSDIPYYGVETQALYNQNKAAFLTAISQEEKIEKVLNRLENELGEKAKTVTNQNFLSFRTSFLSFHDEKTDILFYMKTLRTLYPKENFTASFPELHTLLEAEENQKKMTPEAHDALVTQVLNAFKERVFPRLSKEDSMKINSVFQDYQTQRLDQGTVLNYIAEYADKAGLGFKIPEGLREKAAESRKLSQIKGTKLFDELEQLENTLSELLPKTPEEKDLMLQDRELLTLRDFSKLELLPKDWEMMKADGLSTQFEGLFKPHFEFYELAGKRDAALFQNSLKLIEKEKAKVVLLSTGGFHTKGITERLKDSHIPYLLISPKITQLTDKSIYLAVMRDERSFMKDKTATSLWDALAKDYASKLASSLREDELTPSLKRWRDRIIQNSIAEGRITQATQYTKYVDALIQALRKEYQQEKGTGNNSLPVPFSNEDQLKQALSRELDSFLNTYFNKLESLVNQKIDVFSEGLKNLWKTGDVTPKSVGDLINRVNQAAPKSNLAAALALIKNPGLAILPDKDLLRTVLPGEQFEAEDQAEIARLGRQLAQQFKDRPELISAARAELRVIGHPNPVMAELTRAGITDGKTAGKILNEAEKLAEQMSKTASARSEARESDTEGYPSVMRAVHVNVPHGKSSIDFIFDKRMVYQLSRLNLTPEEFIHRVAEEIGNDPLLLPLEFKLIGFQRIEDVIYPIEIFSRYDETDDLASSFPRNIAILILMREVFDKIAFKKTFMEKTFGSIATVDIDYRAYYRDKLPSDELYQALEGQLLSQIRISNEIGGRIQGQSLDEEKMKRFREFVNLNRDRFNLISKILAYEVIFYGRQVPDENDIDHELEKEIAKLKDLDNQLTEVMQPILDFDSPFEEKLQAYRKILEVDPNDRKVRGYLEEYEKIVREEEEENQKIEDARKKAQEARDDLVNNIFQKLKFAIVTNDKYYAIELLRMVASRKGFSLEELNQALAFLPLTSDSYDEAGKIFGVLTMKYRRALVDLMLEEQELNPPQRDALAQIYERFFSNGRLQREAAIKSSPSLRDVDNAKINAIEAAFGSKKEQIRIMTVEINNRVSSEKTGEAVELRYMSLEDLLQSVEAFDAESKLKEVKTYFEIMYGVTLDIPFEEETDFTDRPKSFGGGDQAKLYSKNEIAALLDGLKKVDRWLSSLPAEIILRSLSLQKFLIVKKMRAYYSHSELLRENKIALALEEETPEITLYHELGHSLHGPYGSFAAYVHPQRLTGVILKHQNALKEVDASLIEKAQNGEINEQNRSKLTWDTFQAIFNIRLKRWLDFNKRIGVTDLNAAFKPERTTEKLEEEYAGDEISPTRAKDKPSLTISYIFEKPFEDNFGGELTRKEPIELIAEYTQLFISYPEALKKFDPIAYDLLETILGDVHDARSEAREKVLNESIAWLEHIGYDKKTIAGLLSDMPTVPTEVFGYKEADQAPQLELIKQDFVKVINAKLETKAPTQMTFLEIGLGYEPKNAIEIINAFYQVLEAIVGSEQAKSWRITSIGLDLDQEVLGKARDRFAQELKRFQSRGVNNISMQAVQANALDLARLEYVFHNEAIGNNHKADYIIHRHVSYGNRFVADGEISLSALYTLERASLARSLNVYLQLQNIIGTFAKPGGRYVIEPVTESLRDTGKYLVVPGAEVIPDDTNSGSGLYQISNPDQMSITSLKAFLEALEKTRSEARQTSGNEHPAMKIAREVFYRYVNNKAESKDLIGQGTFKRVFQIPNPSYVIKIGREDVDPYKVISAITGEKKQLDILTQLSKQNLGLKTAKIGAIDYKADDGRVISLPVYVQAKFDQSAFDSFKSLFGKELEEALDRLAAHEMEIWREGIFDADFFPTDVGVSNSHFVKIDADFASFLPADNQHEEVLSYLSNNRSIRPERVSAGYHFLFNIFLRNQEYLSRDVQFDIKRANDIAFGITRRFFFRLNETKFNEIRRVFQSAIRRARKARGQAEGSRIDRFQIAVEAFKERLDDDLGVQELIRELANQIVHVRSVKPTRGTLIKQIQSARSEARQSTARPLRRPAGRAKQSSGAHIVRIDIVNGVMNRIRERLRDDRGRKLTLNTNLKSLGIPSDELSFILLHIQAALWSQFEVLMEMPVGEFLKWHTIGDIVHSVREAQARKTVKRNVSRSEARGESEEEKIRRRQERLENAEIFDRAIQLPDSGFENRGLEVYEQYLGKEFWKSPIESLIERFQERLREDPSAKIGMLDIGAGYALALRNLVEELVARGVSLDQIHAEGINVSRETPFPAEHFEAVKAIQTFDNFWDGLPKIPDQSVDFVMSVSGPVPKNPEEMEILIRILGRILSADGVAFYHIDKESYEYYKKQRHRIFKEFGLNIFFRWTRDVRTKEYHYAISLQRSEARGKPKPIALPKDLFTNYLAEAGQYIGKKEFGTALPLAQAYDHFAGALVDALKERGDITFVYPFAGPDLFLVDRHPTFILNDNVDDYQGGAELISAIRNERVEDTIQRAQSNFIGPQMTDALRPESYDLMDQRDQDKSKEVKGKVVFVLKGFQYAMKDRPAEAESILKKLRPGDYLLFLRKEDLELAVKNKWLTPKQASRYAIFSGAVDSKQLFIPTGEAGYGKVILLPDALAVLEIPEGGLNFTARSEARGFFNKWSKAIAKFQKELDAWRESLDDPKAAAKAHLLLTEIEGLRALANQNSFSADELFPGLSKVERAIKLWLEGGLDSQFDDGDSTVRSEARTGTDTPVTVEELIKAGLTPEMIRRRMSYYQGGEPAISLFDSGTEALFQRFLADNGYRPFNNSRRTAAFLAEVISKMESSESVGRSEARGEVKTQAIEGVVDSTRVFDFSDFLEQDLVMTVGEHVYRISLEDSNDLKSAILIEHINNLTGIPMEEKLPFGEEAITIDDDLSGIDLFEVARYDDDAGNDKEIRDASTIVVHRLLSDEEEKPFLMNFVSRRSESRRRDDLQEVMEIFSDQNLISANLTREIFEALSAKWEPAKRKLLIRRMLGAALILKKSEDIRDQNAEIMKKFEANNPGQHPGSILSELAQATHTAWLEGEKQKQGFVLYTSELHVFITELVRRGVMRDDKGNTITLTEFENPKKKFKFKGYNFNWSAMEDQEEIRQAMQELQELSGLPGDAHAGQLVNTVAGEWDVLNQLEDSAKTQAWREARSNFLYGLQADSVAVVLGVLQKPVLVSILKNGESDRENTTQALINILRRINAGWRINNPWGGLDDRLISKPFDLEENGGIGLEDILKDAIVLKTVLEVLHRRLGEVKMNSRAKRSIKTAFANGLQNVLNDLVDPNKLADAVRKNRVEPIELTEEKVMKDIETIINDLPETARALAAARSEARAEDVVANVYRILRDAGNVTLIEDLPLMNEKKYAAGVLVVTDNGTAITFSDREVQIDDPELYDTVANFLKVEARAGHAKPETDKAASDLLQAIGVYEYEASDKTPLDDLLRVFSAPNENPDIKREDRDRLLAQKDQVRLRTLRARLAYLIEAAPAGKLKKLYRDRLALLPEPSIEEQKKAVPAKLTKALIGRHVSENSGIEINPQSNGGFSISTKRRNSKALKQLEQILSRDYGDDYQFALVEGSPQIADSVSRLDITPIRLRLVRRSEARGSKRWSLRQFSLRTLLAVQLGIAVASGVFINRISDRPNLPPHERLERLDERQEWLSWFPRDESELAGRLHRIVRFEKVIQALIDREVVTWSDVGDAIPYTFYEWGGEFKPYRFDQDDEHAQFMVHIYGRDSDLFVKVTSEGELKDFLKLPSTVARMGVGFSDRTSVWVISMLTNGHLLVADLANLKEPVMDLDAKGSYVEAVKMYFEAQRKYFDPRSPAMMTPLQDSLRFAITYSSDRHDMKINAMSFSFLKNESGEPTGPFLVSVDSGKYNSITDIYYESLFTDVFSGVYHKHHDPRAKIAILDEDEGLLVRGLLDYHKNEWGSQYKSIVDIRDINGGLKAGAHFKLVPESDYAAILRRMLHSLEQDTDVPPNIKQRRLEYLKMWLKNPALHESTAGKNRSEVRDEKAMRKSVKWLFATTMMGVITAGVAVFYIWQNSNPKNVTDETQIVSVEKIDPELKSRIDGLIPELYWDAMAGFGGGPREGPSGSVRGLTHIGPQAIPYLVQVYDHELNEGQRFSILYAVGEMELDKESFIEAMRLFFKVSHSDGTNVQRQAVRSLRLLMEKGHDLEPYIPGLIEALGRDKVDELFYEKKMIKQLKSSNEREILGALKLLSKGNDYPEEFIPALIPQLEHQNLDIRLMANKILTMDTTPYSDLSTSIDPNGKSRVIDSLVKIFKESDKKNQDVALKNLISIGEAAIPSVQRILENIDVDSPRHHEIILELANSDAHFDQIVLPALLGYLNKQELDDFYRGVNKFKRVYEQFPTYSSQGKTREVPWNNPIDKSTLEEIFKDPASSVGSRARVHAAVVLSKLGSTDPQVTKVLLRGLVQEGILAPNIADEVSPEYKRTYQQLVPKLLQNIQESPEFSNEQKRNETISILKTVGKYLHPEELMEFLNTIQDPLIKKVIFYVIYQAVESEGAPVLVPAMINALKDQDFYVRQAAALILSKSGKIGEEALDVLRSVAKNDPDQKVRNAAMDAVEKIQDAIGKSRSEIRVRIPDANLKEIENALVDSGVGRGEAKAAARRIYQERYNIKNAQDLFVLLQGTRQQKNADKIINQFEFQETNIPAPSTQEAGPQTQQARDQIKQKITLQVPKFEQAIPTYLWIESDFIPALRAWVQSGGSDFSVLAALGKSLSKGEVQETWIDLIKRFEIFWQDLKESSQLQDGIFSVLRFFNDNWLIEREFLLYPALAHVTEKQLKDPQFIADHMIHAGWLQERRTVPDVAGEGLPIYFVRDPLGEERSILSWTPFLNAILVFPKKERTHFLVPWKPFQYPTNTPARRALRDLFQDFARTYPNPEAYATAFIEDGLTEEIRHALDHRRVVKASGRSFLVQSREFQAGVHTTLLKKGGYLYTVAAHPDRFVPHVKTTDQIEAARNQFLLSFVELSGNMTGLAVSQDYRIFLQNLLFVPTLRLPSFEPHNVSYQLLITLLANELKLPGHTGPELRSFISYDEVDSLASQIAQVPAEQLRLALKTIYAREFNYPIDEPPFFEITSEGKLRARSEARDALIPNRIADLLGLGSTERPVFNVEGLKDQPRVLESEVKDFIAQDRSELEAIAVQIQNEFDRSIWPEEVLTMLTDRMEELLEQGLQTGLNGTFENGRYKVHFSRQMIPGRPGPIGRDVTLVFEDSEQKGVMRVLRLNHTSIEIAKRFGVFYKGEPRDEIYRGMHSHWDQTYPTSPMNFYRWHVRPKLLAEQVARSEARDIDDFDLSKKLEQISSFMDDLESPEVDYKQLLSNPEFDFSGAGSMLIQAEQRLNRVEEELSKGDENLPQKERRDGLAVLLDEASAFLGVSILNGKGLSTEILLQLLKGTHPLQQPDEDGKIWIPENIQLEDLFNPQYLNYLGARQTPASVRSETLDRIQSLTERLEISTERLIATSRYSRLAELVTGNFLNRMGAGEVSNFGEITKWAKRIYEHPDVNGDATKAAIQIRAELIKALDRAIKDRRAEFNLPQKRAGVLSRLLSFFRSKPSSEISDADIWNAFIEVTDVEPIIFVEADSAFIAWAKDVRDVIRVGIYVDPEGAAPTYTDEALEDVTQMVREFRGLDEDKTIMMDIPLERFEEMESGQIKQWLKELAQGTADLVMLNKHLGIFLKVPTEAYARELRTLVQRLINQKDGILANQIRVGTKIPAGMTVSVSVSPQARSEFRATTLDSEWLGDGSPVPNEENKEVRLLQAGAMTLTKRGESLLRRVRDDFFRVLNREVFSRLGLLSLKLGQEAAALRAMARAA